MNEFDDPELRRMLRGSSGRPLDVDAAFGRVQGRVRQVKRRRAVALSGAACSVLFAAAVFAGTRTDDPGTVRPAGTGDIVDSSIGPPSTPATSVAATVSSETSVASAPTSASSSASTTTPITTPVTNTITNTATTGTTPGTTVGTPAAPVTRTFSGIGGSITVRMENGTLTLVSQNASAGFATEVQKAAGDRVQVRFESGDQRTEIRVDLVGGTMSPDIKES